MQICMGKQDLYKDPHGGPKVPRPQIFFFIFDWSIEISVMVASFQFTQDMAILKIEF
jgi:hypothetical protein